ncbi:hypothetical protein VCHA50O413_60160 [Vibrio chagasii]|nr:conserved hypothetical protein [Vibrio chagasii]CAH7278268.1 hypothetical protein VCHA50O409_50161 [Vibrio chagasii]CAH7321311.1 hypothetical protein VCHA50O405_50089 [Vibrio chagasii]CAH7339562.1 hypothetical protein VCHA50O402_50163 [Vibrio chagasii]CAH7369054.1 conserved hypothetical protein [Vibrio chagasii]
MKAIDDDLIIEIKHEVVACEALSGDFSLSEIPIVETSNTELVAILVELNKTLSGIPDGSYLVAVAGALSSVIAAFLFNVIYWYVVDVKKRLSSEVAKLEVVLDRFEKTATEYWMHPYNSRHSKGILIKEMRMKAELRLLRDSQKKIAARFFLASSKSQFNKSMNKLLGDLYDCATGGDFETTQRKEDLKRCGEIIRLCTQVRVQATGVDT